jgi:hypothetical protein
MDRQYYTGIFIGSVFGICMIIQIFTDQTNKENESYIDYVIKKNIENFKKNQLIEIEIVQDLISEEIERALSIKKVSKLKKFMALFGM